MRNSKVILWNETLFDNMKEGRRSEIKEEGK